MNAIKRILGSKGNTTIPYEIRRMLRWQAGDPISFSVTESGDVLIRRLAPAARPTEKRISAAGTVTVIDVDKLIAVFERLTPEQQHEAMTDITLLCMENMD